MKSFILKMLLFAGIVLPVQYLYPQQVDLTLKYTPLTGVYEVYARPDFSQNGFFFSGGSQVTVLLPAAAANSPLSVISENGGPWFDNSQLYAPTAAATLDFHGIATNGSTVNFTAGTELLLFRFTLTGICAPGVRIFENTSDPQSGAPGMAGADFNNYLASVINLTDIYGVNYNNTGTSCGTADNDGDGVTEANDPDDNNPCIPNPAFATCDQDNDGLTNQDEANIGTNPTNPDTDGDGINDGTEVTNGSNPLDPCSPNATPGVCDVDNDGDGVTSGTDPDDNNPCVPNPLAGLCDQDSDGLTNDQEATNGTNPTDPDSDDDGINDGTEVANGTDPLNACSPNVNFPTCDQDGDGLTNQQEGTLGTNPTNPDTDGDGINDGTEVTNGSDPLNPCSPNPAAGPCDQDNDGLTNQDEASIGTNPINPDSDGDGINDGTEVTNGSNPLNPCDPNPTSPACTVDPQVEFNLRFDPATCTFSVYARPNFTASNFFVAGGSQISIVLPAGIDNAVLALTSVNGGLWTDNSQIYAPAAATGNDFHAVSSNGSAMNFVAGVEILMFTFTLPGGDCCATGVRLFNNPIDPQSTEPGMGNGDFNNYFADIFVQDNYYSGNYDNNGTVCNDCLITPVPPATTLDPIQEFCLADAPTLADIQVNETGLRYYSLSTGGTPLPQTTALVNGAIYYVVQYDGVRDCESLTRLAITVIINDAPTPTTTDTTQDFCATDAPTVADIQVNEAGVVWYTAATGGIVIAPTTALVNGTYYASITNANGCESSVRLAVSVNISTGITPTTTDTTQGFCATGMPTVADIQINEAGVVWYSAATGGTIIPPTTALVNGMYYASITDANGCESSVRLAVTVNISNGTTPTTTDTAQDFCATDAPTVADIQVNEAGVVWYTAATGGTIIPSTTALVNGIYYASITNANGCESSVRLAVTVIISNGTTPTTTDTTQDFCATDAPTVADIQVNEAGVVWYTTATGGTIIPSTTALASGTYYASITNANGCESSVRLAVTVNISNGTTPTTTDTTQDFCATDAPTVADIQVNETGVVWYTAATGGTIVAATTALVNGTYYASITDANGCESSVRLAVTVNISNGTTPTTTDTTQDFCTSDAPTVADIQVNEAGVVWYTAATGGTIIPSTTALASGTYYASITNANGCESSVRLAVTVNISNGTTPTTTDTAQDFCATDSPTVADIQVNEAGVVWYTAATGGTIVAPTTALVNGTYYASITDSNGCESSLRLAVTVNISNGTTPTTTDSTQDFCATDAPTVADIQVNEAGVVWYTAATGGTVVAPTTALVNGTYYASITDANGCESSVRLAVTVNISNGTTPTTTDTTQDFYATDAPTVADIQVNETGVVWYTAATGGTIVAATTALVNGTYYASITDANGCESSVRLAVTVNISNGTTPTTTDTTQDFCATDMPTVADIQVNEAGVVWYTAATGGTVVAPTTALVNGTYYASITEANGCETSVRLAVTVNISNGTTPTTTDTTQDFCATDAPSVADIQVNEAGVVWYTAATGGTVVTPTTALTNTTYYASIIDANGCESSVRLAVTITISSPAAPTTTDTTQDFCATDMPTVADIQVNEAGVVWYTAATGGTILAPTTALVNGTYYASITDANGCESSVRLAVTVNISTGTTPTTTDTTQDFCTNDNPVVGDIQVNETGITWYNAANGGTVVGTATPLTNGATYYASLTDANGCESATRLAITVNLIFAPTPTTNDTTQEFCISDNPTVANIQVNEPGVLWYTAMTGGVVVAPTTPLVNGMAYYASLVTAGCESTAKLQVTVTLNPGMTPTTNNTTQVLCAANNPTVANIQVNQAVTFYSAATGGNIIPATTAIVSGTTYYASYEDPATGCESTVRLAIQVNLSNGTTPTTTQAVQTFCAADAPTVANLQVNEANVTWYAIATGGAPLAASTPLVNNSVYYASIVDANGCNSSVRLAVTVNVVNAVTPTTTNTTQQFCAADSPTVGNIQVNEPGVVWYAVPNGGTPLASATLLMAGSVYYGALMSAAGCESTARLAVTVNISNGITPTTTQAVQNFCGSNSPTVANLVADQAGVTYYMTATGGTPLDAATPLADGVTYYGSVTDPETGCESAVRLAIQVDIYNGFTPTTNDTTQEFCEGEQPTVSDLQVNQNSVQWYTTPTGGTPLAPDTPLTNGTVYYGSITNLGCSSLVRLAVTVTVFNGAAASITGNLPETCFGSEVTYTTQAGNTGYEWDVIGGQVTAGGTASSNTVTVLWNTVGAGFVSVSYTSLNGCETDAVASIDVNVVSCADITITKTADIMEPRIGDVIVFTITVTNNGSSPFSEIQVSEQLPDGFNYLQVQSNNGTYNPLTGIWMIPELGPGETATMQLWAQVVLGTNYTNIAAIMVSDPIDSDTDNNIDQVTVVPSCLTVYNEFSPNGDGANDYFVIDCIEMYPESKLEVFNRYGSQVYKATGYQNNWDGHANVSGVVRQGEPLPSGTYYYVLEINGKTKTGWLYIMR